MIPHGRDAHPLIQLCPFPSQQVRWPPLYCAPTHPNEHDAPLHITPTMPTSPPNGRNASTATSSETSNATPHRPTQRVRTGTGHNGPPLALPSQRTRCRAPNTHRQRTSTKHEGPPQAQHPQPHGHIAYYTPLHRIGETLTHPAPPPSNGCDTPLCPLHPNAGFEYESRVDDLLAEGGLPTILIPNFLSLWNGHDAHWHVPSILILEYVFSYFYCIYCE